MDCRRRLREAWWWREECPPQKPPRERRGGGQARTEVGEGGACDLSVQRGRRDGSGGERGRGRDGAAGEGGWGTGLGRTVALPGRCPEEEAAGARTWKSWGSDSTWERGRTSGRCNVRRTLAAGLVLVLLFCAAADALRCYVHDQGGGLPENTPPKESGECGAVLDYDEEDEKLRVTDRTDEQAIALQPACFRTCMGESKESARCVYSCTRWSACQMMQAAADDLNQREERDTSTLYFPECIFFPERCRKKYYTHSCCILEFNCNSRASASAPPSIATALLVALATAWHAGALWGRG